MVLCGWVDGLGGFEAPVTVPWMWQRVLGSAGGFWGPGVVPVCAVGVDRAGLYGCGSGGALERSSGF
ncbi:hypothetical protein LDENG_00008340, partial [Lucifuga dentata]